MNIWMIEKNSMKHHYLIGNVYSHLKMEDNTDADYAHTKRSCKDLN